MPPRTRPCDDRGMPAATARAASSLAADAEEPAPRKLYRSADGRLLGGVARGLAGHLGLPVAWVRLVFLGLFVTDGLGSLLYAVFWIVVPLGVGGVEPTRSVFETSPDGRRKLRRPDKGQVFALVALAVGAVAYFVNVDMGGETGRYIWPTLMIGAPCWSGGRRTTPAGPAGWRSAATASCSTSPAASPGWPWSASASRSSSSSAVRPPSSATSSPPPSPC